MELEREEAVRLHRQMWSEMQKQLGDTPSYYDRAIFKYRWCEEHFPGEKIAHSCFLCEYDDQFSGLCDHCPIAWPDGDCCGRGVLPRYKRVNYRKSPISEILALPERENV